MSVETVQALPATGLWEIDPLHSTIRFAVRHHAVATFRGGFSPVTGAFDAAAGTLSGEVRADAVDVQGVDRLKAHLLGETFFDADNAPTISFRSDSLEADADGQLDVSGELTIRGVTRPVQAVGAVRGPVTVRHHDGSVTQRLAIDLTTTIDRREFGITHNNEIAEGIINLGWDVTIDVALELAAPTDAS